MTRIKLKKIVPTVFRRSGTCRSVKCFFCDWLVAAPSLPALYGAGWRMVGGNVHLVRPFPDLPPHWESNQFACASCVSRARTVRPGTYPYEGEVFSGLPDAAPDAFPRIGGRSEKHFDTSRPIEEE